MIVEDQLDRRMGRIGGAEELEEFDEFAAFFEGAAQIAWVSGP